MINKLTFLHVINVCFIRPQFSVCACIACDTRKASTKNARGGADDVLWASHIVGKAAELNHGVSGQEQGKLSHL